MGGETMHDQTCGDMWMKVFCMRHALSYLEPCGACGQVDIVQMRA